MRVITLKRSFFAVAFAAIASACSGGSPYAPSSQQFANAVFPSFLLWLPTSDGAPGGSNGYSGDAIVTTIPFDASASGGPSDVGALPNRVAFFLAGGQVSQAELDNLRSQPIAWSVSANTAVLASAPPLTPPPSAPPGSLSLPSHYVSGGSVPGVATLTGNLQNAPVPITASVKIFTYPVVDVGCTDVGALPGVSFAQDDGYSVVQNYASSGDLYITGPTCSSYFNYNYSSSFTIHTPYGGTLLSLGPIAETTNQYLSNEITPNFTELGASLWKNDFTSIDGATFAAAIAPPCVAVTVTPSPLPSGAINPLPNISACTSTPAVVLIFKTQGGNIVKMYFALSHDGTTSESNIVGAYEATNASGAFPY
jgi:hypothetical protein